MEQQQLFVRVALHAWEVNVRRATTIFDKFTDEQLLTEIAPGKNTPFYLLGHLIAVHDRMLPLLGLGEAQYPQLVEAFINNPDKAIQEVPTVKELRDWWTNIHEALAGHFKQLTPAEWLQKHTAMTDEDYEKDPTRNRLAVLINRTNHLSYHIGQLVLA
ncbi:DinB family protein [Chitinophaga agrisoli]|uniref:DinB family protein n=1 Tax=Chitinophaga agrisoli TaxID=2607653 RepID=A0A5B2VX26_9BACT|nr:DinB family protein [Chitinophaga agrisoli]KAA2243645.1 DinB family protein [Chitinophaga agrisoli]